MRKKGFSFKEFYQQNKDALFKDDGLLIQSSRFHFWLVVWLIQFVCAAYILGVYYFMNRLLSSTSTDVKLVAGMSLVAAMVPSKFILVMQLGVFDVIKRRFRGY